MPEVQIEHKPLIRATISLVFPNLGAETINAHVAALVSSAMRCNARETFVTITPEDEDEGDE